MKNEIKGKLLKHIYSYRTLSKDWILGRIACMGQDSVKLINKNSIPIINFQKGRVDYLLDFLEEKKGKVISSNLIQKYIDRDDIKSLIYQQASIGFHIFRKPSLIVMDSFSELTDQKFTLGNESFFCNYSDVKRGLVKDLNCDGLIEIDKLEGLYQRFFKIMRERFENTPVFYIHFPIQLEERPKFIKRHDEIVRIIETIASKDNQLYSLSVPAEIVLPPEDWDGKFPYHYSHHVYDYLSSAIVATNNPVTNKLFNKYL